MNDLVIYESGSFVVCVPNKPHIPREDGGHIWIRSKERYVEKITSLDPHEAIDVVRLVMLVGEAMKSGMNKRGVEVEIINYQENGKWAYLFGTDLNFHIHLYGRVRNSKTQKWGEALGFPSPFSDFYDGFEPLNDGDIGALLTEISELEKTDKYNLEKWKQGK